MGGMAVLEFFSVVLFSEQVSLKLFVASACYINDTKTRIDSSLQTCLFTHNVAYKLRSSMKFSTYKENFALGAPNH